MGCRPNRPASFSVRKKTWTRYIYMCPACMQILKHQPGVSFYHFLSYLYLFLYLYLYLNPIQSNLILSYHVLSIFSILSIIFICLSVCLSVSLCLCVSVSVSVSVRCVDHMCVLCVYIYAHNHIHITVHPSLHQVRKCLKWKSLATTRLLFFW